ncbi:hypothetical protein RJ641_028900 [Dillenia turbinata]|uniref:Uncharacterized protein n=1 Tax=Dillenia turbinata TaxID=194707 RepID=A0AAN8VSM7_9MAGN
MALPPGPYSGTSTLALVARVSALSFGLAYGSIKLKYLKVSTDDMKLLTSMALPKTCVNQGILHNLDLDKGAIWTCLDRPRQSRRRKLKQKVIIDELRSAIDGNRTFLH